MAISRNRMPAATRERFGGCDNKQPTRKQHAVMKLFNLMKGIFGRTTHAPEAGEAVSYEGIPEGASSTESFASGFAAPMEDAPPATPAPAPARVDVDGSEMVLPLSSIVASFPVELQQRIKTEYIGQINVAFPLEAIMGQLAQGQVRVNFGDIRRAAPHAFTDGPDRDAVAVVLPLGELVSRLQPAMLGRRAARQVEVPDEVASPFAGGGQGLNIGSRPAARTPDTSILSQPRVAQAARTVPPLADPRTRGFVTSVRKPAAPGAAPVVPVKPMPVPARPATPATPPSTGNLSRPFPPVKPPFSKPPIASVPVGNPFARHVPAPGNGSNGNGNGSQNGTPSGSRPGEASPLWISLSVIADIMPESLKLEIAQLNLDDAKLALPADLVQAGLMRGKVAFTWKQLRGWVKPAPLPAVSAHDGMTVVLPLAVIAPLFMGRDMQAKPAGQKRLQVDETIPNLFFGFPQAEAVRAEPEKREIPVLPAPKPAETNYFVWDDDKEVARVEGEGAATPAKPAGLPETTFASRKGTPNDVVMKASLLEGVYGAMVALPDGLLVASKLSPDVNGDAIAALIPQMYSKLSGCTKELRMGELNNLNFTVGNVPWKIFRVNGIFFAAYGCEGEPLPGAHLAELAAELDYKKAQ
jgi:predicted regulator of Ras-like GTPase activity (Roadblock/LC7/MglB family)